MKKWTTPLKMGPNAFICDIDGTLSIRQDRSPYDLTKVLEDKFNHNLWFLIKEHNIIFVSGREGTEQVRKDTIEWLKKYTKITSNDFYMDRLFLRLEGDFRKDDVVKSEIYEREIEPHFNIIGVFDDRDRIVKMWRDKGLFCMQVNYGDF